MNAGENPGRVEVQVLEDKDSVKASNKKIERWKLGEVKLYATTYILRVEKIEDYKFVENHDGIEME